MCSYICVCVDWCVYVCVWINKTDLFANTLFCHPVVYQPIFIGSYMQIELKLNQSNRLSVYRCMFVCVSGPFFDHLGVCVCVSYQYNPIMVSIRFVPTGASNMVSFWGDVKNIWFIGFKRFICSIVGYRHAWKFNEQIWQNQNEKRKHKHGQIKLEFKNENYASYGQFEITIYRQKICLQKYKRVAFVVVLVFFGLMLLRMFIWALAH